MVSDALDTSPVPSSARVHGSADAMSPRNNFMVGDIISMPGPHPTLPKELERKYFRVEAVDERGVKLSRPYVDAQCTIPYRAIPPALKNGSPTT